MFNVFGASQTPVQRFCYYWHYSCCSKSNFTLKMLHLFVNSV